MNSARFPRLGAAHVFLAHSLGDALELVGRNQRSRRVAGRAQAEQVGVLEVRRKQVKRGLEAVFFMRGHFDRLGLRDPGVVVVVPAWQRIDHRVAGVQHAAVSAVKNRPCARSNKHAFQGIAYAKFARHVIGHSLAQREHAIRGRIIGFTVGQRARDALAQSGGNRELLAVEIAHRQVAHLLARGNHLAHGSRDLQNLAALEAAHVVGKRSIQRSGIAEIEFVRSCGSHGWPLA